MSRSDPAIAASTLRDVALGGAAGALLRAGAVLPAVVVAESELVALVALNALGAYLLGRLLVRAVDDVRWRARLPLLGTGLLGSLTTFSGLAVPLALLWAGGAPLAAAIWALVSLATGVWAAAQGLREVDS
ncbi:CrcB family protein [Egicoccus sp. AB-alg2]|uniref:CrcB family protein n=1 Tax=Egicoccus sp. AB-alg2 TaxID=3242693 RepID=UPI00359DB00F